MSENKIKFLFYEKGFKFSFSEYQDIFSVVKIKLIDLPMNCNLRIFESFSSKVTKTFLKKKIFLDFIIEFLFYLRVVYSNLVYIFQSALNLKSVNIVNSL